MWSLSDLLKEFSARNVVVVFRPMHFWSGLLLSVKKQWFCYINSKNPSDNQRWTLAHELGHYVLHRDEGVHFTDGIFCGTEADAEWQANRYASEILMPPEALGPILENMISPEEQVGRVARRFEVPSKMVAWWLFELGYIGKKCYASFQQESYCEN